MTIIVATRDRIVSDSRLSYGDAHYTVGKIFRCPDGSLLATAGDDRLTHPFEKAYASGEVPEPLEVGEDEHFEGVILKPDGALTLHTASYSPYPVGDEHVVLGNDTAVGAATYILKHGGSPEEAVAGAIEVDPSCGGRIVTVMLHGAKKSAKHVADKIVKWPVEFGTAPRKPRVKA